MGLRIAGADVIEQLEYLVARVEQVAALRVEPLRRRAAQQSGGVARAERSQRGRQRALDPVGVTRGDERLQPAGQLVEPAAVAVERPAQAVRHRPGRLRGDLPGRVAERQIARILAQVRREVRHAGEAHQPLAPPRQPAGGEAGDGGDHPGRVLTAVQEPEQRLGLDQSHADIEPALQAPSVEGRIGAPARSPGDHDLSIDDPHLVGGYVVGEQVERAAAGGVEPGVVPVTGQDAVAERAAVQRKPHVRAAVVHGRQAVAVGEHRDRDPVTLDQDDPLGAHRLYRARRDVPFIDHRAPPSLPFVPCYPASRHTGAPARPVSCDARERCARRRVSVRAAPPAAPRPWPGRRRRPPAHPPGRRAAERPAAAPPPGSGR